MRGPSAVPVPSAAVAKRARRDEVDKLRAELTAQQPYLDLAQQIHDEIERVRDDPTIDLGELADTIDRWPREARDAALTAAFADLAPLVRWTILADLFDDDELRGALAMEHERAALGSRIAAARALDTRELSPGAEVVVGLFREVDVRAALGRGSASTSTARRLVLRATEEPARLVVIEDVFNPARGLFVTAEYDEATWRAERLGSYEVVSIGAALGGELEPVVYPGGRLDVRTAEGVRIGRLHTGYVTVGDADLFIPLLKKETG